MRTFMTAALAAAALATSAGAVTITSVPGPDGAGQHVLFNFNSGAPAGLTGNYMITTGTAAQKDAAPLGDATPYLAVPGQGSTGTGGSGISLGIFAGNQIPGATADGA